MIMQGFVPITTRSQAVAAVVITVVIVVIVIVVRLIISNRWRRNS